MSTPSVYVLTPASEAGKAWLEENLCQGDEAPRLGNGYVVEWRYMDDIVKGMRCDGLTGSDVEIIY